MSGRVADFRETPLTAEELAMLDRARGLEAVPQRASKRAAPLGPKVAERPVLGPRGQWACELAGVLIGRGLFWGGRGLAWVAGGVRIVVNRHRGGR